MKIGWRIAKIITCLMGSSLDEALRYDVSGLRSDIDSSEKLNFILKKIKEKFTEEELWTLPGNITDNAIKNIKIPKRLK